MDQRQVLRHFEYLLANLTWSGGAKVFGHVNTSGGIEGLDGVIMPAVIVQETGFDEHEEHGELGWYGLELLIVAESRGDRHGRGAVMGHGRSNTTSAGRGLKELQSKVLEAVKQLGDSDGISHLAFSANWSPAQRGILGIPSSVGSQTRMQVFIGNDAAFPAPTNFAGVDGGLQADLTWTLPAARFDRVGVHIRRKTGSAATSVTDGTAVYTGDDSSYSDTGLSAGVTYYYSIWGAYQEFYEGNDLAADTPDAYSALASISVFIGIP